MKVSKTGDATMKLYIKIFLLLLPLGLSRIAAEYNQQITYRCKNNTALHSTTVKQCRLKCAGRAAETFKNLPECTTPHILYYQSFAERSGGAGYPCDKYFQIINPNESPSTTCGGANNIANIQLYGHYNESLLYKQ